MKEDNDEQVTAVIELYDIENNKSLTGIPLSNQPISFQSLSPSSDPKWSSDKLSFSQKYEYFVKSDLPNIGQITIFEAQCNIKSPSKSSIHLLGSKHIILNEDYEFVGNQLIPMYDSFERTIGT